MTKYRHALPQINGRHFLSDSGLETTMIFHEGIELPYFAAITMLTHEKGRDALSRYFDRHVRIALTQEMGFILDTPTWRSSPDWAPKLGMTEAELDALNREAVGFVDEIRRRRETSTSPMVVNGVFGPRGDGYKPEAVMTADAARRYHSAQMKSFAEAGVDMVSAITMTHVGEAIGIAQSAADFGLPAVISFTVETDGRLPTGQPLSEAITETDAATGNGPAYYMVNCAHPSHFNDKLESGSAWMKRVKGIRANASKRSHAELDEAQDLDDGNPVELGLDYRAIALSHPQITVVGGCCGTDHRHIEEIAKAMVRAA